MKITSAIKDTISVSQFTGNNIHRIISDVQANGPKLVMMDNEPVCVLLSPDKFVQLMDELEDAKLAQLALERVAAGALTSVSTQQEVMAAYGITEQDLSLMDDVEIE